MFSDFSLPDACSQGEKLPDFSEYNCNSIAFSYKFNLQTELAALWNDIRFVGHFQTETLPCIDVFLRQG